MRAEAVAQAQIGERQGHMAGRGFHQLLPGSEQSLLDVGWLAQFIRTSLHGKHAKGPPEATRGAQMEFEEPRRDRCGHNSGVLGSATG